MPSVASLHYTWTNYLQNALQSSKRNDHKTQKLIWFASRMPAYLL
jgi:hypothetical protein